MSFLYIGTFGSFIGYSFAFGLVLQTQFGRTPLQAASLTFIGPLLGSLIRPVGGAARRPLRRRADHAVELRRHGRGDRRRGRRLACRSRCRCSPLGFIALFVLSGLGNGSTYKMIPGIFQAKALARGLTGEEAAAYGRRLSGASMGLIGAVGALGGLGINLAFRQSFLTVGHRHRRLRRLPRLLRGLLRGHLGRIPSPPGRRAGRRAATAGAEAKPQLSYAEV